MADLSFPPKLQFFDANGVPLVGGKLYSYAAGTTTPLATYTSSAETTFNPNPIILNSRGEAEVWLGSPMYKFKLTTPADVEIWTVDNITSLSNLETSLLAAIAASAAAVQASAVAKAGDTMTGALNFAPEVSLASAGTTNIGAANSNNVQITGTTAITNFGTVASGTVRNLRFAGALTLTHNATSLILPGGANITTAAGDTGTAISLGSGNWVVTDWQRASALPFLNSMATARLLGRTTASSGPVEELTAGAGLTLSGGALSVSFPVRAWVNLDGTGTPAIRASGNVSSITDNAIGDYTVNFTTAMADNNYAWAANAGHDNQLQHLFVSGPAATARATWRTTTSLRVCAVYANVSANTDPSDFNVAVFR